MIYTIKAAIGWHTLTDSVICIIDTHEYRLTAHIHIEITHFIHLSASSTRLCLTRHFSVCPLANARKTTDRIFMIILTEMYLWTKKK